MASSTEGGRVVTTVRRRSARERVDGPPRQGRRGRPERLVERDRLGELVTAAYEAGQRGDPAAWVVDQAVEAVRGCGSDDDGTVPAELVKSMLDGWQLGSMASTVRAGAVDGLTGLGSPVAFTSHLRLLYERAAWFNLPASSMAAIVTCGRRSQTALVAEGMDGLTIALATTAALRDVVPPGTPCARLGNGRLAALLPLDEEFGPTMARLLATLQAADPDLTAEIVSLPEPDDLDHMLAALI
jgi:hypothetical protein